MKLYFEDRYEQLHLIAEVENDIEANKCIHKFIEEKNPNFKIYYIREWINDLGMKVFDVGSHSEFFLLEGKNE